MMVAPGEGVSRVQLACLKFCTRFEHPFVLAQVPNSCGNAIRDDLSLRRWLTRTIHETSPNVNVDWAESVQFGCIWQESLQARMLGSTDTSQVLRDLGAFLIRTSHLHHCDDLFVFEIENAAVAQLYFLKRADSTRM